MDAGGVAISHQSGDPQVVERACRRDAPESGLPDAGSRMRAILAVTTDVLGLRGEQCPRRSAACTPRLLLLLARAPTRRLLAVFVSAVRE